MGNPKGRVSVLKTGSLLAGQVAVERHHPRFVVGDPAGHPVAKPSGQHCCVLGEGGGGLPVGPPPSILECLGQIPVVERRDRFDSSRQQPVDETLVEGEAGFVDVTGSVRQHPRPGDREPIGAHPHLFHQFDVFGPTVVVVAGHVTGGAVFDRAVGVGEPIPDRFSLAVFVPGALDLVAGGGGTPQEAGRKVVC